MGSLAAASRRRLTRSARNAERLYGAMRREARIGLSSAHTSPHSWAEVTPDGSYLAVHVGRQNRAPVAPARRGAVHGFSRQSRSRLLKTVAKLDKTASSLALFVTLTYPESFKPTYIECKRDLDTWLKRLRRKFPRATVIWRLELQDNEVQHFHLIVLNVRFIPMEWVANSWYEVVGSGYEKHREVGTEVRRVVSYKQAFSYAAKYAAKMAKRGIVDTEGRVWGVVGRKYIPIRLIQWELDGRGEARLTRAIRNLVSGRRGSAPPPEHWPRWAICDGGRALRIVAWAAELTL